MEEKNKIIVAPNSPADVLAKEAILNENFNKEEFTKLYAKEVGENQSDLGYKFSLHHGVYSTQLIGDEELALKNNFGYQFAVACAGYTVQLIGETKNNDLEKACKRFGAAVLNLNALEFAYAIDYFKVELAQQIDKHCSNKDNIDGMRKTLLPEVKVEICKHISTCKGLDQEKKEILINSITDYDKIAEKYARGKISP